jgi:DNA-binding SARP family transcriptional activator
VLADLLWDRGSEQQLMNNMRVLLSSMRRELGPYVAITRESVAFDRTAPHWLDIAELAQDLTKNLSRRDAAGRLSPAGLEGLAQSLRLYRGEFLQGFYLRGGRGFEEWLVLERERWQLQIQDALRELVGAALVQGRHQLGLAHALRWVELAPLSEVARRQAMLLYARTDQWTAALNQFETGKALLYEEMGMPPAAETVALYEAIKAKQLPPAAIHPGALPEREKPLAPPPLFLAEQATRPPPTTFVGRERELVVLASALQKARAEGAQFRFVVGEAGQGKTMLVREFVRQAQLDDPDLLTVFGYGHAHTGLGDPYHPFREALALLCGDVQDRWESGLIDRQQARRLWQALPQTIPTLVAQAPHLVDHFVPVRALLDQATTIAPQGTPWLAQLTRLVADECGPKLHRKDIFGQTTAFLKAIAGHQPLLLILEDLHWADPASCSLLFHLSRNLSNSPILLIGTYRPEEMTFRRDGERHAISGLVDELKRQHGDIWLDLGEMTEDEGRQFVAAYLDSQPNRLGPDFREALFRHTGGHPLFTAELVHDMRARGDLKRDEASYWMAGEAVDWQTLPTRVEGVIETRLRRLNEAQQALLTTACVEGERFTACVVARVHGLDERAVVQQLSRDLDKGQRLVTAQAVERIGDQRLSRYRFRHHLIQHYLYHNLDAPQRTYLHEAVGTALEALYGEQTQQAAIQLARHFQRAGIINKAVHYLLQAGEQALGLGDYEKAVDHLSTGLKLLETAPQDPWRAQQESMLQTALGDAMISARGPAAPEVRQAFERARDLCLQVGQTLQNYSVWYGLTMSFTMQGELLTARELGQQFLHQAEQQPESAPLLAAHHILGCILLLLGQLTQAQTHLEKSVALYQPEQSQAPVTDQFSGAKAMVNLAFTSWILGYPDQAWRQAEEAVRWAEAESNPNTLACVQLFATMISDFRRETLKMQKYAETTMAHSAKHGLPYWHAGSTIIRNAALVRQGKADPNVVDQMRCDLAIYRSTGAMIGLPYMMSLLAKTLGRFGMPDEGLSLLDDALAMGDKTGHCTWEAELHRLKGELLWSQGADELEVEACFQRAIEIARRQQARSLELRAVTSLSRLWQAQSKTESAYQRLAEMYHWFSEGFETPDLVEARDLLTSMAHEQPLGLGQDQTSPRLTAIPVA